MDGINTPNQTASGQTPGSPNLMNQNFQGGAPKSSMGPIIGSIIVVLVVVLGGLYLYGQQLGNKAPNEEPVVTPKEVSAAADQATISLGAQGSTDSMTEINKDLTATEVSNLDAEMQSVDQNLSY